jgi:hypothetical protein
MPKPLTMALTAVSGDAPGGGQATDRPVLSGGAVDGVLEAVRDGCAVGWAYDRSAPRRRISLELVVDGERLGRVVADMLRPSLEKAAMGDGRHGFCVNIPSRFNDDGEHSISLVLPTGEPLRAWHEFAATSSAKAPAQTLTKLFGSAKSKSNTGAWDELLSDLLEPEGRDRRRRAVQSLNGGKAGDSSSAAVPATKPAYRRGWLVATVTDVLKTAREPMRARAIHHAAEKLAGEPVSWSSVRNCLASGSSGKNPRFERLGYGQYRVVPDADSR